MTTRDVGFVFGLAVGNFVYEFLRGLVVGKADYGAAAERSFFQFLAIFIYTNYV